MTSDHYPSSDNFPLLANLWRHGRRRDSPFDRDVRVRRAAGPRRDRVVCRRAVAREERRGGGAAERDGHGRCRPGVLGGGGGGHERRRRPALRRPRPRGGAAVRAARPRADRDGAGHRRRRPALAAPALLAAVVVPLAARWAWNGGWLQRMGFVDYAGAAVIHLAGGLCAA